MILGYAILAPLAAAAAFIVLFYPVAAIVACYRFAREAFEDRKPVKVANPAKVAKPAIIVRYVDRPEMTKQDAKAWDAINQAH